MLTVAARTQHKCYCGVQVCTAHVQCAEVCSEVLAGNHVMTPPPETESQAPSGHIWGDTALIQDLEPLDFQEQATGF